MTLHVRAIHKPDFGKSLVFVFECDSGKHATPRRRAFAGVSIHKAFANAGADGWVRYQDGRDFCPDCVHAASPQAALDL